MRASTRLLSTGAFIIGVVSVAACGGSAATPAPTATPPQVAATAPGGAGLPSFEIPVLPSGLSLPSVGGLGSAPDASSIVTGDMAASVLGATTQKVAMPVTGIASIVAYTTAAGDTLTVLVEKVPGGVPAAAMRAAMQMAGSNGDLQAVSGIGDVAGKTVDSNEATIAFAKGDFIVVLSARSDTATGADLEPKLESLARQVTGKL